MKQTKEVEELMQEKKLTLFRKALEKGELLIEVNVFVFLLREESVL